MAIQVKIEDDKIDNFSDSAKNTLKKQLEQYADNIIKEANLVEESTRESGASTEITSNIILLAISKNKGNYSKKSNKWLVLCKVTSSFSLLFTGLFFDSTGYQNNITKFIVFIVVFAIACVSTVLQFVFEDKE